MRSGLQLEIRTIEPRDHEACLRLFDSNMPHFFAPYERAEFEQYLTDPEERGPNGAYLVLEADALIVACGGYFITDEGMAGLAWGMVARDRQREGFGTRLIVERLRRIAARPGVREVILDTTQRSSSFFEGLAFKAIRITPDGYGAGLDRVDMRLELNDRARAAILERP